MSLAATALGARAPFPRKKKICEAVKKKHLTSGFLSCMITQVIEMEKIVQQGLLYDFYGELLTKHQQQIYEDVVINDMSLSEIAQEQGISRQGVHDLVRRCDKILSSYEEKLHLVEKFQETKRLVAEIETLTAQYQKTGDGSLVERIGQISREIAEI